MGSTCFFVDLSDVNNSSKQQQKAEPANLLTVRKPGTPTKRASGNSNYGEENKTLLGNQIVGDSNDSSLKNKTPQLPLRLQKRLESLPGRPSAEKILMKEEKVLHNREQMMEAKIANAKFHNEEKCEVVRQRKKEYEKNMALLGNTIPSNLRELSPIRLPKKLQRRLKELDDKKSSRRTLDREEAAAHRRANRLEALINKQHEHLEHVEELMIAKNTVSRYEVESLPSFLPKHLKARLAEFRKPTGEAILRKERQVASRRALLLDARSQSARTHNAYRVSQVQALKKQFLDNEVEFVNSSNGTATMTKLPKRLAKRLAMLEAKKPKKSILAKENEVVAKRLAILKARKTKLHQHLETVLQRRVAKFSEQRFADIPSFLPKKLQERLASFRKPTAQAILMKEDMAGKRKQFVDQATAFKAHGETIKLTNARALKQSFNSNMEIATTEAHLVSAVKLPKKLQNRLSQIKAKYDSLPSLSERLAGAEERRGNRLEGVVAAASEHTYKVESLKKAKRTELRFGSGKIPQFLPDNLKKRMESIRRLCPEAILRKNANAAVRAQIATNKKATVAHLEVEKSKKIAAMKKDMNENGITYPVSAPMKVKLPKRLAKRAKKLAPKWTAESIFERCAHADAIHNLAVQDRRAFATEHNNKHVAKLFKQRTHEPRYDDLNADILPNRLLVRLEGYTRRTTEAILRKNARAAKKREIHLESIRQASREHGFHVQDVIALKQGLVENEIDLSGTPYQFELPEKLRERLTKRVEHSTEEILKREELAYEKHKENVKTVANKAKAHGKIVKQRLDSKDTVARYENVAEFVPENLKERLAEFRKPTSEALMKKYEMASMRAQQTKEATAFKARLHSMHAEDVVKTGNEFRDHMVILTKGETQPVKLPQRLEKRLEETLSKKPTPQKIITKEKEAAERRDALLQERRAKLSTHSEKVHELCTQKTTQPRFSEEEIAQSPIPQHLKERLKQYRSPTKEAILNKEARVEQRHNAQLQAKIDQASKHGEYVSKVKHLKEEMAKNIQFLGDERSEDEKPEIPAPIKERLEHSWQKFQAPKSPEDILRKHTAVQNQREALLSERVASAKMHTEKVMKVMQEHKKQKEENPTVPETD